MFTCPAGACKPGALVYTRSSWSQQKNRASFFFFFFYKNRPQLPFTWSSCCDLLCCPYYGYVTQQMFTWTNTSLQLCYRCGRTFSRKVAQFICQLVCGVFLCGVTHAACLQAVLNIPLLTSTVYLNKFWSLKWIVAPPQIRRNINCINQSFPTVCVQAWNNDGDVPTWEHLKWPKTATLVIRQTVTIIIQQHYLHTYNSEVMALHSFSSLQLQLLEHNAHNMGSGREISMAQRDACASQQNKTGEKRACMIAGGCCEPMPSGGWWGWGCAGKVCQQRENWVREEGANCNNTHNYLPAKPTLCCLLASGLCGNRMPERWSRWTVGDTDSRKTFVLVCLMSLCGISREFRCKWFVMSQFLPVLVPAQNNGGTKLFPSISLLIIFQFSVITQKIEHLFCLRLFLLFDNTNPSWREASTHRRDRTFAGSAVAKSLFFTQQEVKDRSSPQDGDCCSALREKPASTRNRHGQLWVLTQHLRVCCCETAAPAVTLIWWSLYSTPANKRIRKPAGVCCCLHMGRKSDEMKIFVESFDHKSQKNGQF